MSSINIHHEGAVKTWYGVPANMAAKLESLGRDVIGRQTGCDFFFRHKALIYPPHLLQENQIDFGKVSRL